MMLGTIICIGGLFLIWITALTTEGMETEPGIYTIETKWWADMMPFIIPLGLLLFGTGYFFDSLKTQNESNNSRDQNSGSKGAIDS